MAVRKVTWCREAINNANDYVCLFFFVTVNGKRNVLSNCNVRIRVSVRVG